MQIFRPSPSWRTPKEIYEDVFISLIEALLHVRVERIIHYTFTRCEPLWNVLFHGFLNAILIVLPQNVGIGSFPNLLLKLSCLSSGL